jgi:transcriptional regulator with XRE-family HTH domain
MNARNYNEEIRLRIQAVCNPAQIDAIAAAAGVCKETVRRVIRGDRTPSVRFLKGLGDVLGISSEWLVHGRGPRHWCDVQADALRTASLEMLASAASDAAGRTVRAQLLASTSLNGPAASEGGDRHNSDADPNVATKGSSASNGEHDGNPGDTPRRNPPARRRAG